MMRISPVLKSTLDKLHSREYAMYVNYLMAANAMEQQNLPALAVHF